MRFAFWAVALALGVSACDDENGAAADASPDAGVDVGVCSGGPGRLELISGELDGKGMRDGQGSAARFWNPSGMVRDGQALYIADTGNAVIRRLDLTTRQVTLFAGSPGVLSPLYVPRDGPALSASFFAPRHLALTKDTLFVADGGYVRMIDMKDPAHPVTTLESGGAAWGAAAAPLRGLAAVDGVIYIAQIGTISAFDPATGGKPVAVVGQSESDVASFVDGDFSVATFGWINAVVAGGAQTLFVADRYAIRVVDLAAKTVTSIAGHVAEGGQLTSTPGQTDGTGSAARFLTIEDLGYDGASLFVTEVATHFQASGQLQVVPGFGSVRRVDPLTAEVTTVAGTLPAHTAMTGELDGAASKAILYRPTGVLADGSTLLVTTPSAVRTISGDKVGTLAGEIQPDFFIEPGPVAVDQENLYVVLRSRLELGRVSPDDGKYNALSRYHFKFFGIDNPTGLVLLDKTAYVAGEWGIYGRPLGGTTSKALYEDYSLDPGGLTTDGRYLLFLGVMSQQRRKVLRLDPAAPEKPVTLDAVGLYHTHQIAMHDGGIYVADGTVVARLDAATAKVKVIAGARDKPGCGDGAAGAARFRQAVGMATDGARLYVGDVGCHALRVIDLATGRVTTAVGASDRGFVAEGAPDAAALNAPAYLAYDSAGDTLYISDPAEDVLLKLPRPGCVTSDAADAGPGADAAPPDA